ncbi:hypothetical protein [Trichodesmium erythraeum]|uniref:hypothetical protein n=1 Tax=Trichodesmium erythraeum TaxID=1206 RepID=UPI00003CA090|nr:hypothetical protein [Trichodesmium erythraeum GBRTRLIN201]
MVTIKGEVTIWVNCQIIQQLQQKVSEILLKIDELTLASLTKWNYLIEAILSVTSS